MPVNVIQYRSEIGVFYNRSSPGVIRYNFSITKALVNFLINCIVLLYSIFAQLFADQFRHCFFYSRKALSGILLNFILTFFGMWYLQLLLLLGGDIHTNPGPPQSARHSFSFLHWNLNSVFSHNFSKISLLTSYNSIHKYDFICLAETFLNSDILSDDNDIAIPGYSLLRSDHPSNSRRGGVCLYYRQSLPLKVLDLNYLDECIIFEINIEGKQCFFLLNYRSPSQSPLEFEEYLTNFQLSLDVISNKNPFLFFVIGDFNAKSTSWCKNDSTTNEGREIESMTSQFGLHQIIKEPTHIINNSFSCIDLIFCNQPNLIIDSGVHSSLHPCCHHQIVYAKVNLKIYYPPSYERTIWHYNRANADYISRSIDAFNWENAFLNCNCDEQVELFTKTLTNVFNNFIPHTVKYCNDKDPPWINNRIKMLISLKDDIFQKVLKDPFNLLLSQDFTEIQKLVVSELENSKQDYYKRLAQKLISNRKVNPKFYWTMLKTLLSDTKIPCIPPLIAENKFVTDFEKKAELFNIFFAKQCSVINNDSSLPTSMFSWTNKTLSEIRFCDDDILKIINNLDSNKAHSHDMISIRMLKLCGNSICKPLRIIFKNCLAKGYFPEMWKKANVIPIHKKNDKQSIKNYRPVSLLPICGKIFERIIYNQTFKFFLENELISPNQSGFKPGDSCVNQLLSISHQIHQSLDENLEVRGIFLDISKAFDRVWHDGLVFKLKQNGISGNLLELFKSFLKNRKQRVVLNGQISSWANVSAGVPQGSILGPLFFLIYINDLCVGLESSPRLFADDISLFSAVNNINLSANQMNMDLIRINQWAYQWKMQFNPDPLKQAQEIIFSRKIKDIPHPSLFFNECEVKKVSSQKHLGLILDCKLDFNEHLKAVSAKVCKGIGLIKKLNHIVPRSSLLTIYKSFVRPHLDYGDVVYDQTFNESFHSKLEKLQYSAALAITGAIRGSSRDKLYQELGFESLNLRRWYRKLVLFHKITLNKSPSYLYDLIPKRANIYQTRQVNNIPMFKVKHNFFRNSFFPSTIIEWNKLDSEIRTSPSSESFKRSLLKIIRPVARSIFDIHNPLGIKLLTRLRLGLSHLRDHKFHNNFQDCINPLCLCGDDIENNIHFFLHCQNYNNERRNLLNEIEIINEEFLNLSDSELVDIILFGSIALTISDNKIILNASINFILETKRFDGPLF